MKILITGATGFVGSELVKKLERDGHELKILTRNTKQAKEKLKLQDAKYYEWKNYFIDPTYSAFDQIDGVVHRMGENIGDKKWTSDQKEILYSSRIDSANSIVNTILKNEIKIKFFITASAIGIYPTNQNITITESSNLGSGFLAKLCQDWENSISRLPETVRKIYIRTGVVLDKNGGALKKMILPFQMGVGGIIGNGQQMMSWIHRDDLINLYSTVIENSDYQGVINACSPNPVSNYQFTKTLGKVIHRPTILPVPEIALKVVFGEMSSIILDSQSVKSEKLNKLGFQFHYPNIEQALQHSI